MRLRHFLVAGWRAALASRTLSLIALFGLAIGLTAAILMAIVIGGTLGQNRFVPERERTYLAVSMLAGPGAAPVANEATNGLASPLLAGNIAAIEAWARLAEEEVSVRHDAVSRKETVNWADPALADVLPLPVLRGDLAGTLARPDGVALGRDAARRWFGTDDVLGRPLTIAGRAMTVGAILSALPPSAADPRPDIVASALNTASVQQRMRAEAGGFAIDSRAYFRLRSGSDVAALEEQIRPLSDTLLPVMMKGQYRMRLARIDRLALDGDLHPGARERLVTGALIAALVLVIAVANHVNLALARAVRRRKEIGIRKAAGAGRWQIAAQFLGEAVATALIAALLAMAASEWLIEPLNAFLDTNASIDYLQTPGLVVAILAGATLVGLVAGAYPAVIVSRLSPVAILRPSASAADGGTRLRALLATVQFAVLIGLLVAAGVVHQQRRFAMTEGSRADIDQMLTVAAPCPEGFVGEVARLPGVRGVSCSGEELFSEQMFAFVDVDNRRLPANIVTVLPSLFPLYGIVPVAGSLAGLPSRGEDQVRRVIINEAAVRQFGLGRTDAAVGKTIPVPSIAGSGDVRATIVAVVPDFQFTSVQAAAKPTIYLDARPSQGGQVSIRLAGRQVPETLVAIDRLWQATGGTGPIERRFLHDRIEELYLDLARSTQLFAGFSALAMLLAAAGMIGIAIATTDRRTKEIGIRKAMGAGTGEILTLLIRELARPALVANLIAWPIAWFVMQRWLDGYAYHIAMPLWLFPAAGAAALGTAVISIAANALAAARQNPIRTLRYE